MKINKKSVKLCLRAAVLTAVVLVCVSAVFLGICEGYVGIRKIGFGENVSAVQIEEDYIRILDFKFKRK